MKLFRDRMEAGELLATNLLSYQKDPEAIVLALPRGGVPIGFQLAKFLQIPLDVFLVRKLGVPGQEELALGAIATGGTTVYNNEIVRALGITTAEINLIIAKEMQVLQQREKLYRNKRPPLELKNKTVILTDDGIATGATMLVAIRALQDLGCKKIIVAVPVAPADTCQELQAEVDEIVCLEMPYPFYAVGNWYQSFPQTSDDEVKELLAQAENFKK